MLISIKIRFDNRVGLTMHPGRARVEQRAPGLRPVQPRSTRSSPGSLWELWQVGSAVQGAGIA